MLKILINTPDLKHIRGGVTNHYNGLKPFWKEKVYYNTVGKRNEKSSGIYWLLYDIIKYIYKIIFLKPDVIILNPSFNRKAILRDSIFLRLSIVFRIKTVIMFHGWTFEFKDEFMRRKLNKLYNKSMLIFVLAESFKDELLEMGIDVPILLTSTKVDDRLLDSFDLSIRQGKKDNYLFLARLVKEKGIYETIDTFVYILNDNPNAKLTIVGSGNEEEKVKAYVKDNNIKNIIFTGNLDGKKLIDAFKNSDIYFFISSHGEGMPTSVLEAMAFGLPIITTPVGGLKDFFNEKMGIITESKDSKQIYNTIKTRFNSQQKLKEISVYNHNYAIEHFLASKVANYMEINIKYYLNK